MPEQKNNMKTLFDLYRESKVNRFNFLEKKKQEFLDCTSDHKRKNLIAELIQLEPSHLAEDWILDQVIKMMKDRLNNIDYLQAAFIAKGKRNELTKTQRDNLAKTSFLSHKIDKISKNESIHKIDAASRILADLPESEDSKLSDQPANAIMQRLKRYRKTLDKRTLPFPYYGLDFIEFDAGNDNHRVEYYIFDKPITYQGHILFGSTKMSIPAPKE